MLGKVLDLQTARTFFTRHGEIDTANDKLHEDVGELNKEVEGSSSELYKVQKEFLANGRKYQLAEGKLRGEQEEDGALIRSMNAELSKGNDVQKALKKLTKIHDELLAEAIEARNAGEKSVAMLNEQRAISRAEVKKHKSLRDQLVQMNNYSVACHAKVEKKSKKLGQAMVKSSQDNKAAGMTLKQKRKANTATQQRLLAERALLVSEVKRVEHSEKDLMDRLTDLREDFQVLEQNIVDQVRTVKAQLLAEKERVKSLRTALMENTQAEEQDLTKKRFAEEQIAKLTKKIHEDENPITIATFEGQNAALQAELTQAYVLWKTVKQDETQALLNVQQAASELASQKNSVILASRAVVFAQEQGEKKLAEAVKTAEANKKKAQALVDKAQTVVAEKCKPKWDKLSKRHAKRMKKCRAMSAELTNENAKKDSLMQILKARAEVP